MCGIIGSVGKLKDEDFNWLKKAIIELKHRGPDASSSWISSSKNAALAHTLSIIDTQYSDNHFFLMMESYVSLQWEIFIILNFG